MRHLPFLSFALTCLLAMATTSLAQSTEEAAIRTTLGYYIEGGNQNSRELMEKAFHKSARLQTVRDTGYVEIPLQEYINRVASGKPNPANKRKVEIVSVDVFGTSAVGKIRIETDTAIITDYMSLLKIQGQWRIVNKLFLFGPKTK